MTVCLTMIVRDEAHVIERCLRSAAPWVDTWAIVDTGSSDETPSIVERTMLRLGLPGRLYVAEWRDFGINRSEALERARVSGATHSLMIDADETLEGADVNRLRDFKGDWAELSHECAGHRYYLPRLTSNAKAFGYAGVLHEYVTCPPGCVEPLARVDGITVRGHFDSARNQLPPAEKYARDAAVLLGVVSAYPDDARSWYYLAQSHRDAGHYHQAALVYQHRAEMGGWDEERWHAQYQAVRCRERSGGASIDELRAMYRDAARQRPWRAEPLEDLARLAAAEGDWLEAAELAYRAMVTPYPESDRLFVDQALYAGRAREIWERLKGHAGH